MEPVIIVGNGVAAVSAAEAFRKADENTPLIIISEEPYYAYYRLRLSQNLGDAPEADKLLIHGPEWYGERNIKVMIGRKATGIDLENRSVLTQDGPLIYSKLLLAQGSTPFVPPVPGADLPGVFTVRTLQDVINIHKYLSGKKEGIVVGGGVLGLEVAWALAQKGQNVTVIEGSPYILSRQLNKPASDLLEQLGRAAGISFVVPGKLRGILGEDAAAAVRIDPDEDIPADYVIFSTGVRPNTVLAKGTSIDVGRGIIVDEYMQTSADNVYSAGDAAQYKGNVYGLWSVAKEQGKCAGLNMAKVPTPYDEIPPSNYIKVFGTDIYSAGDLCPDGSAQKIIEVRDPKLHKYKAIFIKEDAPVGAVLFGDTKEAIKITRAIKSGTKLSKDILAEGSYNSFMAQIK